MISRKQLKGSQSLSSHQLYPLATNKIPNSQGTISQCQRNKQRVGLPSPTIKATWAIVGCNFPLLQERLSRVNFFSSIFKITCSPRASISAYALSKCRQEDYKSLATCGANKSVLSRSRPASWDFRKEDVAREENFIPS